MFAYICETFLIDPPVTPAPIISMSQQIEYYQKFLLRVQREAEAKKKEQQRKKKDNVQKKIHNLAYPHEPFMYEKKMTNDELIEKGNIIRIKSITLSGDFRVQAQHEGIKTDAIASRQEIIEKNISALLDFYEKQLKLKDLLKL